MTAKKPPDEHKPSGFQKGGAAYKPPGGDGWGGAASPPVPFAAENQPPPEAKSAGKFAAAEPTLRDLAVSKRAKVMATWEAVIDDKDAPHAAKIAAAAKIAERSDGLPRQHVELSGPDGDALKIEAVRRVIVDPKATDG